MYPAELNINIAFPGRSDGDTRPAAIKSLRPSISSRSHVPKLTELTELTELNSNRRLFAFVNAKLRDNRYVLIVFRQETRVLMKGVARFLKTQ
jgi:hypothetical protein